MKFEFYQKVLRLSEASSRDPDRGFTLIELLVVIIIIGILSAIALPSFLNQANKARESEGKQYVGSMNRAQQAYFLERQRFTSALVNLGLGIQSDTTNYSYSIHIFSGTDTLDLGTPPSESNVANLTTYRSAIANVGTSQNTGTLRSYIGAIDVMLSQSGLTTEGDGLVGVLCQSESPAAPHTNAVDIDLSTTNTGPLDCSTANGFETLE